jgi:hypothetical protein
MEDLLGKHLFSRQKDNLEEIIFYRGVIFRRKKNNFYNQMLFNLFNFPICRRSLWFTDFF